MKTVDKLRKYFLLIALAKTIKILSLIRKILLLRIELKYLTPLRRDYLFAIFVKVPLYYNIIMLIIGLNVEEIGIIDLFVVLINIFNIMAFFILCFMQSFLLIPSVVIRLINKKPLSWIAWVVCPIPIVVFISCYALVSIVGGVLPIGPLFVLIYLVPQVTIASYFVLKFPARYY